MFEKNQLMIAIPTKNHPEYMRYYMAKILRKAKKYGIDIFVYDSSDNDETEKIIKSRIEQGYSNLFYIRLDADILIENKLKYIFVREDYEYIWLCGDGVIVDLDKDVDIVQNEFLKDRDLICFGKMLKNGKRYKEYSNSIELLQECWAPITYYGASIVKSGFFSNEDWEKYILKYKEQIQPSCFFEFFSNKKINVVYIVHDFFEHNPYKTAPQWIKEGRLLEATVGVMTDTIKNLPDTYECVKNNLDKSMDDYVGISKIDNLWEFRANNNLNVKEVLKYKKQIKKKFITSYSMVLLISLCPAKIADDISVVLGGNKYGN